MKQTKQTQVRKRNVASRETNMLKRILLTLTFAAAVGAAGFCLTDRAEAQWGRWNPNPTFYAVPGVPYVMPYRTYRRRYLAPQRIVVPVYGDPGYYYYGPPPGVAVQVAPW
jgi:hypothetical protein